MPIIPMFPPSIRTLGRPAYRSLNAALSKIRAIQSRRIPQVELQARHIANLRVVVDRAAFLEAMPKQGVVAELGVNRGDFSAQILEITRSRKLHLVDVWDTERYHEGLERLVRDRFRNEIADGIVEIDRGLSTEVLPRYPEGHFDWVYIDTDHSYRTTAAELELARRVVKPGGIIAGHDYVTGNWDGGVRYGVVEAVHEFCVRHDWELRLLTHETNRHLSFAIRAIGA